MTDADEINAIAEKALRVRVGSDPRWHRFGNVSEMGGLSGIGWANWLAERVPPTCVPPEFWSLDADAGAPVAIVACPCRHEPVVRKLASPAPCRAIDSPECPRSFFFDGENVYAFNSPSSEVPVTILTNAADPGGA